MRAGVRVGGGGLRTRPWHVRMRARVRGGGGAPAVGAEGRTSQWLALQEVSPLHGVRAA